MKFEFGRHKGEILLADEICPDTCRFWDKHGREARQGPLPARPRRRRGRLSGDAARRICGQLWRAARGLRDPEARASSIRRGRRSQHALHALGFAEVGDVRVGKYIELRLARRRRREAAAERVARDVRAGCSPTASSRISGSSSGEDDARDAWGVVVFPGSNDDQDALRVARRVLGDEARAALAQGPRPARRATRSSLPGGFSYGDYLRCGAMARVVAGHGARSRRTPPAAASCSASATASRSSARPGCCPGRCVRNRSLEFVCESSRVRVETTDTPFTARLPRRARCSRCRSSTARAATWPTRTRSRELEARGAGRLPLRRPRRPRHAEANPNGALDNIAGVCNASGNVVGPDAAPGARGARRSLGGDDGLKLFRSAQAWLGRAATRRRPRGRPRAARPSTRPPRPRSTRRSPPSTGSRRDEYAAASCERARAHADLHRARHVRA